MHRKMFRMIAIFRFVYGLLSWLCSAWPLVMWITLLLVCSILVRSFSEITRLWIICLPPFFAFDLLRRWLSYNHTKYISWLARAYAACYQNRRLQSPHHSRYWLVFPIVSRALAVYMVAFIFFPKIRCASLCTYNSVFCNSIHKFLNEIYPPATREFNHIIILGNVKDAYEINHFIIGCLCFSMLELFVISGPRRDAFAEWMVLEGFRRQKRLLVTVA
jgi:hypothetical protein